MPSPPYRRDTLELTLEHIRGGPSWADARSSRERLVIATLLWPRPLIAERMTTRAYRFAGDGLELAGRDWTERILFKENVEGPFGLTVQVTEPLTAQQIKRLTAALGEALLKTAGSELARVAVGPWLSTLGRFPFTYLAGELAQAGKTPAIAAAGRVTIRPGSNGPVDIPLTVPEDLVRTRLNHAGGRTRTRRETIHRRGDPAGSARLLATYYRA